MVLARLRGLYGLRGGQVHLIYRSGSPVQRSESLDVAVNLGVKAAEFIGLVPSGPEGPRQSAKVRALAFNAL
jgi:hypothetical protein